MRNGAFAVKGDICYTQGPDRFEIHDQGIIVCEDGKVTGVFDKLPEKYDGVRLYDYSGRCIVPGLTDLHLHAPQYDFRALGMDMELLEWLEKNAFPQEARFSDGGYAKKAYSIFAEDLKRSATTRACIFATQNVAATEILMDILEKTGLETFVGKVNMDRNCPDYIVEKSAAESVAATRRWLEAVSGRYTRTKPILTPRFIPACSDGLMEGLGRLQTENFLPVQSHLSENLSEIEWVKALCPEASCYGQAYARFGLFGGGVKTVMAHCVHSSDEEIDLMKRRGVYIAHCPASNTNLISGVAPVRRYLENGMNVGLGSDIAGGASLSIFRAMTDAVQVSKLRWRLLDQSLKPLTTEEAFYLGTKGGGSFFGRVGSFEPGYEFDAVVLDDGSLRHSRSLGTKERLERLICLGDDSCIAGKFVAGEKLDLT